MAEEPLDPELEIIDPHHHLWDRRRLIASLPPPAHPFEQVVRRQPRYLIDDILDDVVCGHRVTATVHIECGSMYRLEGPPEMRPVGETEFVVGIAAMSASGGYGEVRLCAGVVGHVDLTLGEAAAAVMEAHLAAGGGRFRGVRHSASHDPDPAVLGPLARAPEGLYRSSDFQAGFARLGPLGLSFDAWMLEPQLPDLISLADRFPETTLVLDHVGTPLGIGAYQGRLTERFAVWRERIRELAERPNVCVKLGGLGMPFNGLAVDQEADPAAPVSERLCELWRPYLETCLEAFGPGRAMFESNFPVDKLSCGYDVLWNAFKRFAAPLSLGEKEFLFADTARRVYRLP